MNLFDDPDDDGDDYSPPGGEPWVVTLGVDEDDDLVIQALTENVDLPGVDVLEHRFFAAEVAGGVERVAVYAGVMVHACKTDHGEESCRLFAPDALDPEGADVAGTASLDDLPEHVLERVGEPLNLRAVEPRNLEDPRGQVLGPDAFDMAGYGSVPGDRENEGVR
jgi:hypothetical protein